MYHWRSGVRDQPDQYGETLSLKKKKKDKHLCNNPACSAYVPQNPKCNKKYIYIKYIKKLKRKKNLRTPIPGCSLDQGEANDSGVIALPNTDAQD